MNQKEIKPKLRCAIYTRKSHEDGLEQEYNSLAAQYDAALHYINSQRQEGWTLVNRRYDDGGFSGGNMERPALQRLLDDVRAGEIDVIVFYKIDRLSRALLDFAQLVGVFDKHGVSFVSVTENFNTTTPMGRLTLNMLLSFAQFEREVIGERIRDKFAASKSKGIWMGGTPPLGYDVCDRKLIINRQEAKIVTFIFDRYLQHGSIVRLVGEMEERCYRSKSWTTQKGKKRHGKKLDAGALRKILRNPIYYGMITHKDKIYKGEHEALIKESVWTAAQNQRIERNRRKRKGKTEMPFILRGIIFDHHGVAMTPTYTGKGKNKNYRYYVSMKAIKEGYASTDLRSLPAEEIEPLIVGHLRQFFTAPEIIQQTYLKAREEEPKVSVDDVRGHLQRFDEVWDQLFPAEQNRIVQLVIKRIDVCLTGVDVTFQPNGIMELYAQLSGQCHIA